MTVAEDGLAGAWNAVLGTLRLPALAPAEAEPAEDEDRLAALARRSNVRVRRVALPAGWWRRDCGPLIGLLEAERRHVALVPRPWGGYDVLDPGAGEPRRLSPETAAALSPFGHAVYRTFAPAGAGKLGIGDVVRFATARLAGDVLLLVVAGLVSGAVVGTIALAGRRLVDDVIPADDSATFAAFGAALLVSTVCLGLVEAARAASLVRVAGRMRASVQGAVWDRLLTVPAPFFRRFATGDLAGRAFGLDVVEQLMAGPAVSAVFALVTSLASWVILFGLDPVLALSAAVASAAFVVAAGAVHARTHRDRRHLVEVQGRLAGLVFQLLNGIAKLKVAAAEDRAFGVWGTRFEAQHGIAVRVERRNTLLQALGATAPTAVLLAVLALLTGDSGRLSLGEFVAFSAALTVVLNALLQATFAAPSLLQAVTVLERARPILDEAPELDAGRRWPGRLKGAVELCDVTFRYGPDEPTVLAGVSLRVEPGTFVAIVGPSGSGKSTLLRLLLGFERPIAGVVRYDGQDLAELDVAAVRRQLGVVLQDARLLPGATIFDNIAGARRCTLDDAWAAARAAGLADDIEEMPMGMHTFVAEGAKTFSGGQRQRLLVARALVARPSVVLLDEATSWLDNRTQQQVAASVGVLHATRIVIAHRLSTIMHADRIYVLAKGVLAQSGTYEELMSVPGPFAELARRQVA